ncbi:hypothetical protein Y032_0145g2473 [Ancylostoma ceylanicum]|uniref:Uncharacterized protein n=1 Tax=Ancylostoma ceylanicum TaxID=53326 RepID=A0A016T2P8_9BILA|nr:hypothetical protein Y032_0145g2473 [Ancylostoma ceylanicum]
MCVCVVSRPIITILVFYRSIDSFTPPPPLPITFHPSLYLTFIADTVFASRLHPTVIRRPQINEIDQYSPLDMYERNRCFIG